MRTGMTGTTAQDLNDSLDRLGVTALRVKRERDALLEAGKEVVRRWEHGDLAEAVRWLASTIKDCEVEYVNTVDALQPLPKGRV